MHPYHRNDELIAFCKEHGIHVTAYSPLGSPDSATMFKRRLPSLIDDVTVQEVAAQLGRTPAQACMLSSRGVT